MLVVVLMILGQLQQYLHVIAKIFEYCLINKLSNYLSVHESQFEFTKGGGCDKALLLFKTVFEYFNNHGSTVFVATLDLIKTYDRLNQCILIFKLYDVGILRDIVMMLVF